MIFKELASTGIRIPEVGIGTWGYRAGPDPLRQGLEAGALFIDTAESYGTEQIVGQAVKGIRDQVFIATKVSPEHFHAIDLRKTVDTSLRLLGIGTIDLLQLHKPNPSIPLEETMAALAGVIDAGKVRFAGVSNFSVAQLREARQALGKYPIVSNQVRYSLIDRTAEKELLPYCQANNITVIADSPLGREFTRIRDCDPTGIINSLASDTGKSPAQIVINWCLCKEGVVAIPKGNSASHILDNCAASDWRLTKEQIALLDNHIQYRYRDPLDTLVRRYLPGSLHAVAKRTMAYLPRDLRRRFT